MNEKPTIARAATANGEAIKKLRLDARKTQKEVIRGSTVPLRTYQRAEEGKSVARETLGEIARLLKVTFEAVVKDDAEKNKGQVKLLNCGGKGGSRTLKLMQGLPNSVLYSFDLDPGPEEAEKIAAVVDFCKSHTRMGRGIIPGIKQDASPPCLDERSSEFSRAVGQLNAKLNELADFGVNVFVGSYLYWEVALEAIEPDVEDEEYVQRPDLCRQVLITFSKGDDEFILANDSRGYQLKERCYERAAQWNYKHNTHPDLVNEIVDFHFKTMRHGIEFLAYNREYWNKQKTLEQASKPAVAQLTASTKGASPDRLSGEGEG